MHPELAEACAGVRAASGLESQAGRWPTPRYGTDARRGLRRYGIHRKCRVRFPSHTHALGGSGAIAKPAPDLRGQDFSEKSGECLKAHEFTYNG